MNLFNGMFGKIEPGLCRLSMNGEIAVRTKNGYKAYSTKTGRLTNFDSFVFDIGQEFFFVVPTNKVAVGDIILVNGKPRCVKKMDEETITVINYEDSTIENILPERHIFMGNTYFYGKIVSMFGGGSFLKKKKGMNRIMQYMMLSEMFKDKGSATGSSMGGMSSMLMFMLMGKNMGDMFEGLFNFDEDEDKDEERSTVVGKTARDDKEDE